MLDATLTLLLTIAALGAGLMAGVYFAFSGFIMKSFDRLGAEQATDAMNAINEVILRSWFMPLFFGSTLLFLLLAAVALLDWSRADAPLLLAAGLLYVGGMFLCTAVFNVPLNNRLAAADSASGDRQQLWSHYYRYWTRWNHLRAICSLLACLLCILALAQPA